MKKLMLVSVLMTCLAATAHAELYTDHVDVNKLLSVTKQTGPGDTPPAVTEWGHVNPYAGGDYEEALLLNLIDSVKLSINVSQFEITDDDLRVSFKDKNGTLQDLGSVTINGVNEFVLNPNWLDGVTVSAILTLTVGGGQSEGGPQTDTVCIGWSELKVDGRPVPVPVPGAVLLGMLGLGYAGRRLRRFV